MSLFFAQFPKVFYDLERVNGSPSIQVVTNIMARVKIREAIKQNAYIYYIYNVKESDTPEIVASKYYGDPNRAWIILMANDIVNPQYDWPLSSRNFGNYIIAKYGSIAAAQTTTDHYEKVINKTDSYTGTTTLERLVIDQNTFNSLPVSSFQVINLTDGQTVTLNITTATLTQYQAELEKNENKRQIKIIDKQYVNQIEAELQNLLSS